MSEEKIVIIDEQGQEIEMEVLFTFDSDETKKQYVLYFNPEDESGEVYVSSYTEDGQLIPIEDEKEWELINEVFETFMSADEEEHHHDHNHEHHHHGEHCGCNHDHDHEHKHEHKHGEHRGCHHEETEE